MRIQTRTQTFHEVRPEGGPAYFVKQATADSVEVIRTQVVIDGMAAGTLVGPVTRAQVAAVARRWAEENMLMGAYDCEWDSKVTTLADRVDLLTGRGPSLVEVTGVRK